MPRFIPGLELARRFYAEAVRPILDARFPGLAYAAALIGDGSEVLGYDTPMSTDHDWGPRVLLFLTEADHAIHAASIDWALGDMLPLTFHGYGTSFEDYHDGTRRMASVGGRPLRHRVQIHTIVGFTREYLTIDISQPIDAAGWLTLPEQKLLATTAGAVFHDDLGLEAIRGKIAYYPRDVWLYLLASTWQRIGQEEHLMGRAGYVGDELGSSIIASRLVRDLMRLCFLIERRYAPYAKWFGTAFASLGCARELMPVLVDVQAARTWREREAHLVRAYEHVAAMQNDLCVVPMQPAQAAPFFGRPFRVIHLAAGFSQALRAEIVDPAVRGIADRRLIGSIDVLSDNTDLVSDASCRQTLRSLFE